jgi:hypothetical protein
MTQYLVKKVSFAQSLDRFDAIEELGNASIAAKAELGGLFAASDDDVVLQKCLFGVATSAKVVGHENVDQGSVLGNGCFV